MMDSLDLFISLMEPFLIHHTQAYELLLEGQLGAVLVEQLRGALVGDDGEGAT